MTPELKRMAPAKPLHGAPAQIFTCYETDSPDILYWRPMNDKRDELMKIIGKPLLKKIAELKKKGKIQIYEFNE